ncbi:MAG TPA: PEP-CTERM sorting domain-containing protein [Burkholderiaceae bacterium]|nr:PEP-CTERM sorting domain-containing protein [Burkholderiaceae bacterium]
MSRLAHPILLGAALAASTAQADTASFFFEQDTAYRSTANIPVGFYDGGTWSFLEDFEDGSLGGSLTISTGSIIGPGSFNGFRDGVDADDGVLDSACGPQASTCRDWFSSAGSTGLTITFTGATLPTAFGVVWTDGSGTITFSAKDVNGNDLGSIAKSGFADGSSSGTTGEDRFFGATYAGGIKSIFIKNSGGGIEIDHVQYGDMVSAVPEPGPSAMLLAGLAVIGGLATRRRPG